MAKNLIYAMKQIEELSWIYFDSLELNQNYLVKNRSKVIEMPHFGSYTQKLL